MSKSLGSTNKANTAYATIEALRQVVPKEQWVTTKNAPAKTRKTTAVEAKIEKSEAKPAKKTEKVEEK